MMPSRHASHGDSLRILVILLISALLVAPTAAASGLSVSAPENYIISCGGGVVGIVCTAAVALACATLVFLFGPGSCNILA